MRFINNDIFAIICAFLFGLGGIGVLAFMSLQVPEDATTIALHFPQNYKKEDILKSVIAANGTALRSGGTDQTMIVSFDTGSLEEILNRTGARFALNPKAIGACSANIE